MLIAKYKLASTDRQLPSMAVVMPRQRMERRLRPGFLHEPYIQRLWREMDTLSSTRIHQAVREAFYCSDDYWVELAVRLLLDFNENVIAEVDRWRFNDLFAARRQSLEDVHYLDSLSAVDATRILDHLGYLTNLNLVEQRRRLNLERGQEYHNARRRRHRQEPYRRGSLQQQEGLGSGSGSG